MIITVSLIYKNSPQKVVEARGSSERPREIGTMIRNWFAEPQNLVSDYGEYPHRVVMECEA